MLRHILILIIFISSYTVAEEKNALKAENGDAEAVCINGLENTCYILLGNSKIDVTGVEAANLGKLSTRPREEYSKIINIPTKWLSWSTGEYVVNISTQAWFKGQQYTVTEPVLIKNGIYHQR